MDETITGSGVEADFHRRVYTISGMPFDALNMEETIARVYAAVDTKTRCFISTPNLNFLMSGRTDPAFRQSVVNSDLSLADGMPLIWMAKLLKIPLKERVAGSSLFEALMLSGLERVKPVKVFFFGGSNGVAETACRKLEEKNCGLHCVGSLNPGFGSTEEMSGDYIIDRINRSGADFVIVSLGARKGQQWIERNRQRLEAPVISHLGAVVNFIAGTTDRAPGILQRLGLEWLWRIKEEPGLWNRYFFDGIGLMKLLFSQVLPYAIFIRRKQKLIKAVPEFSMDVVRRDGTETISIRGMATSDQMAMVRNLFVSLVPGERRIRIRLVDTVHIDPAFCGCLLILYKHVGGRLCVASDSHRIIKELKYNGIDFLLERGS